MVNLVIMIVMVIMVILLIIVSMVIMVVIVIQVIVGVMKKNVCYNNFKRLFTTLDQTILKYKNNCCE